MGNELERWNEIFHLLSSPLRRQVIDSLLHAPPDRELSIPEAGNPPEDLRDPLEIYIELMHTHIPKLEAAGVVEFLEDPPRVRRGPSFDEVGAVVEGLLAHDDYPPQLREGCHRLGSDL